MAGNKQNDGSGGRGPKGGKKPVREQKELSWDSLKHRPRPQPQREIKVSNTRPPPDKPPKKGGKGNG